MDSQSRPEAPGTEERQLVGVDDDDLGRLDADIAAYLESRGDEEAAFLLAGLPPVPENASLKIELAARTLIADRYVVEEELGRGAQGVVYRCRDLVLVRDVALKLLHRFIGEGAETQRLRFEREARTASRLDHPALCPVLDYGEFEGSSFLVMKLVAGVSLAQDIKKAAGTTLRLRSETSGLIEACHDLASVFATLAEGLEVAHRAGVIHRDVKPGNIVVEGGERPILLDFGCARDVSQERRLTLAQDVLGTVGYMAPESLNGTLDELDVRLDVYSLGICLFECLSGTRAFDGHSRAATAHAVMTSEPRPLRELVPDLPRPLAIIVATATAHDPDRRYASAEALAADLRRYLEGRPILARPPHWLERSRMWVARNPYVASLLAACLVALAFVAFFSAEASFQRGQAERAEGHLVVAGLERGFDLLWPMRQEKVADMEAWLEQAAPHQAALGAQVAEVERRRASALSLQQRSIQQHLFEWKRAVSSEMGVATGLEPIVGLVPLGPDPDSGLQEFLHLDTHEGPLIERDSQGRLHPDADTGIILVLMPGGPAVVGEQNHDRTDVANYRLEIPDHPKSAKPGEKIQVKRIDTVIRVQLEPYLLSKYELTLGQWRRIMGREPNRYPLMVEVFEPEIRGRHPVEMVSWFEVEEFLRRVELRFPSEVEWEHAARGGKAQNWWPDLPAAVVGARANLADLTAFRKGALWVAQEPDQDDGFLTHAPVDQFEPNAYGFHAVVGNVWEWCAAFRFAESKGTVDENAKRTEMIASTLRPLRGSSFENPLKYSYLANRQVQVPDYKNHSIGVRPALSLSSGR